MTLGFDTTDDRRLKQLLVPDYDMGSNLRLAVVVPHNPSLTRMHSDATSLAVPAGIAPFNKRSTTIGGASPEHAFSKPRTRRRGDVDSSPVTFPENMSRIRKIGLRPLTYGPV